MRYVNLSVGSWLSLVHYLFLRLEKYKSPFWCSILSFPEYCPEHSGKQVIKITFLKTQGNKHRKLV